jgi:chorismate synthase
MVHDPLRASNGSTTDGKLQDNDYAAISRKNELPVYRLTNHAGGVEGGMTNGERLCLRAYMKPIPTMRKGLPSVSYPGFENDTAHFERSDVCAIAAASVVVKAMVAFVLVGEILGKFGKDNFADIKTALNSYRTYCSELS